MDEDGCRGERRESSGGSGVGFGSSTTFGIVVDGDGGEFGGTLGMGRALGVLGTPGIAKPPVIVGDIGDSSAAAADAARSRVVGMTDPSSRVRPASCVSRRRRGDAVSPRNR